MQVPNNIKAMVHHKQTSPPSKPSKSALMSPNIPTLIAGTSTSQATYPNFLLSPAILLRHTQPTVPKKLRRPSIPRMHQVVLPLRKRMMICLEVMMRKRMRRRKKSEKRIWQRTRRRRRGRQSRQRRVSSLWMLSLGVCSPFSMGVILH